MSKHRQNIDTIDSTVVFGSASLPDQIVAVEAEHDQVAVLLTPEAAVVLARVLGNVIRATRGSELARRLAPHRDDVDPDLWSEVAKGVNAAVLRARGYDTDVPAAAAVPLILVGVDA